MAKKTALGGYGAGQPASDPTLLTDRIVTEFELLTRNVDVLQQVGSAEPIGIIWLSELMDLPTHKVRYSLHLLEQEGMSRPTANGAVATDRAKDFWDELERGLDRMTEAIQFLKERVDEQRGFAPSRKGE